MKLSEFSTISTHAPAGGATIRFYPPRQARRNFYSRPCGRGDAMTDEAFLYELHFYSRPCGRGDITVEYITAN